ncbi:MAG: hypothetical protein WKG32_13850 [Gemmatimonadaceae bacterium]
MPVSDLVRLRQDILTPAYRVERELLAAYYDKIFALDWETGMQTLLAPHALTRGAHAGNAAVAAADMIELSPGDYQDV